MGKTTFLATDLIPALQGSIVIYVDLWRQPQANQADLVEGPAAIQLSGRALNGTYDYAPSGLICARAMTSFQRVCSVLMKASNSAPVLPTASAVSCASLSLT